MTKMKLVEQLDKRMTVLEKAVEVHLLESGEIRTDLAWIKKSMWVAIPIVASVPFTLLIAIVSYLLKAK